MRRLIINADDFGLTSGVNRGIVESHAHGVVTSATLMACGEKFAEAAVLSAQEPRLSVGCHVVLVDGVPVLDAATVPSLTVGPKFRDRLTNFPSLNTRVRREHRLIRLLRKHGHTTTRCNEL